MKYIFATVTLFVSANAFAGEGSSCHFHGDKPAAESSVIEWVRFYSAKKAS